MHKSKVDFIVDLLNSKKVTAAQKERVIHLTSEEIKKSLNFEVEWGEKMKQVEIFLKGQNHSQTTSTQDSSTDVPTNTLNSENENFTEKQLINSESLEALLASMDLSALDEYVDETKIKASLTKSPESTKKPQDASNIIDAETKIKYHHPCFAKKKLAFFSKNDIYKQFTHHIENTPFDYQGLMKGAKENWKGFLGDYFDKLNAKTYFKIEDFIFTKKKDPKYFMGYEYGFWTNGYVIPIGWNSQEIQTFCDTHIGQYPSNVLLREKAYPKKTDRTIRYDTFADVIKRFKHDIELRTEDKAHTLDVIIRTLFKEAGLRNDFPPPLMEDSKFKSVEFFADMVQVKTGILQIFKWIKEEKHISDKIVIDIEDHSDHYILFIKHDDAYLHRKSDSPKNNGLYGHKHGLRETLRSVCDWEFIYTDGDGESYAYKYLEDGCDINEPVAPKKITPQQSIIHKLIFYK